MARLLLAFALFLAVIHYSLADGSVSADSAFDQSKALGAQFRRSLQNIPGNILGKVTSPEQVRFYRKVFNMDSSEWPKPTSPTASGNACSVEITKTVEGKCLKLEGSYACVTPDNIFVLDESCA